MKKISCDSLFGTDEMLRHCPFQNYITLFSPPPPSFFIAIQSWPGTHGIKFPAILRFFFSSLGGSHILNTHTKQMLHHCPFQKYIALFSPPTQFFFKAIQGWPDRHFIKFLQVYKFFSQIPKRNQCSTTALSKTILHFFLPPTQIFFIA